MDFLKTRKLRFFEGLLSLYRGTGDLRRALTFLGERLRSTPEGAAASRAARDLGRGGTLTDAVSASLPGMEPFERGLLEVGERSGGLEAALAVIIDDLHTVRRTRRDLVGRLAYPVFILHFAGVVFCGLQSIRTGWSLAWPVLYFGLLYAPVLAGWLLVRAGRRSPGFRVLVLSLPLVGPWRKNRLRARFSFALGQLYSAGVPIARALEITASSLGPGPVSEQVRQAAAAVERGEPLSRHVPAQLDDPLLRDAVALAERSGSLSEELARVRRYYRDRAERDLGRLVRFAYGATFALAVLLVAWLALSVYASYYAVLR